MAGSVCGPHYARASVSRKARSILSYTMRMMTRTALLALSLLALACGPLGPLPGGEISGMAAETPSDWSAVAAEGNVQLETRPSDPYSVNLWGVGLESGFYVASGRGGDASWVKHIEADPNVRLRIGAAVYELRAERVTGEDELAGFSKALEAKYDFDVTPEQRDRAWIFRLDPR